MVYIKLAESLYQRMKEHILPDKLVSCNQQLYISYPEFSTPLLKQNALLSRTTCPCIATSAGRIS